MCALSPTRLSALNVESHFIGAYAGLPNTSLAHKPLLIYRAAFAPSSTSASALESHFRSLAVVLPQWRYTMYATTHFHSTTHEVLAVARGSARLCFGGTRNPARVETVLARGDVVVVPAGVAHCLLEDLGGAEAAATAATASAGASGACESFEMVGCYPPAAEHWDMCYGDEPAGAAAEIKTRISALPWFERDPVYGDAGPALDV